MKIVLLFLSFFSIISFSFAQDLKLEEVSDIEIGKTLTFKSKVLNEERTIWVRLPGGYENGNETYPVVYLLDGNDHFIFTSGVLRKLERRGVERSILVAIPNTNRTRDLTPSATDPDALTRFPNSGGANDFLKMLETELIPVIKSNYRTKKFKTLIGHSFGGLFVTHVLTENPALFNAYISISPSLWWDAQKVVSRLEKSIKENGFSQPTILYMTMGNEGTDMLGGMLKMAGVLETELPSNLRWEYAIHKEETHSTIPLISTLEGLSFIYKDWYVPSAYEEYLAKGSGSFRLRAERIKNEFNQDWSLDNLTKLLSLHYSNDNKDYSTTIKLGEIFEKEGSLGFDHHIRMASAYIGLNQMEGAKKYLTSAYQLNPGDIELKDLMDSIKMEHSTILEKVELSKKEANRLTGLYVSENSDTIVVKNNAQTLELNRRGNSFELLPISKTSFYIADQPYNYSFLIDEKDKSITLRRENSFADWRGYKKVVE